MAEMGKTCIRDGCDKQWVARGLCEKHYRISAKSGKLPARQRYTPNPVNKGKKCYALDCTKDATTAGLCTKHYTRKRRGWPDWETAPDRFRRDARFSKAENWQYKLYWNYGMLKEQYEQLLADQGGGCAICGGQCPSGRRLAVDHDHKTGAIRGLLCSQCNQAIGKLKEDTELMMDAMIYLISHQTSV